MASSPPPQPAAGSPPAAVVLELTPADASHLAWLLLAGHTNTPFIAGVIADITQQLREMREGTA